MVLENLIQINLILSVPITASGLHAAGASAERRPWRKVRTAQGGVAANGCPPRGEDQSNRDESARSAVPGETGNLYAQQHRIGRR